MKGFICVEIANPKSLEFFLQEYQKRPPSIFKPQSALCLQLLGSKAQDADSRCSCFFGLVFSLTSGFASFKPGKVTNKRGIREDVMTRMLQLRLCHFVCITFECLLTNCICRSLPGAAPGILASGDIYYLEFQMFYSKLNHMTYGHFFPMSHETTNLQETLKS